MNIFKHNPLCADLDMLSYLSRCGNELEKSMAQQELIHSSMSLYKSGNVGKIQVEKTVTRDGSTFIEKYWKSPDEGIAKDEVIIGGYHNLPANHPEHPNNRTYKEFQSSGASNLYFGNNEKITLKSYGKWASGLDEAMKKAVNLYTHGLDRLANGLLRKTDKKKYPAEMIKKIYTATKVLEQSLDQFELKDDIVVHRKCSANMLADFLKSPHQVWQDHGFTSTSTVKGSFSGKIEGKVLDITIKVPKGKGRGAWVSPMSHFPNENEFLLNRGSMFKITSIKGTHIEMTWVGRDPQSLNMEKSLDVDDLLELQPNPNKFLWDSGELQLRGDNSATMEK